MAKGSCRDATAYKNNSMIYHQLLGLLCCGVPGTKCRGSRKCWEQLLALPGQNTWSSPVKFWSSPVKFWSSPVKLSRIQNCWHPLQAVSDIERAVQNILQFVAVDFIGIIISAGLCYKVLISLLVVVAVVGYSEEIWHCDYDCHCHCNKVAGFNIFKTLGYLQKEYGMMLAVSQVLL